MNREIIINKNNKSIIFVNNEIAFSQFGVADEILDLINELQKELKYQKEMEIEYNKKHTLLMKKYTKQKEVLDKIKEYIENHILATETELYDKLSEILEEIE